MRQINTRVVRKLTAADGYLELGMPAQALTELGAVGDAGPLQPAVDFMTGLALKDQQRYEEAIEPLQKAAIEIPAPHNHDAWLSLGECYRKVGSPELAVIAEMFAEDPGLPPGWECELAAEPADEIAKSDAGVLPTSIVPTVAGTVTALQRGSMNDPASDDRF